MPNVFEALLAEDRVLLADGATGTNLQKRGLAPGESPEDWIYDRPDEVQALHRSFVDAGSDLVLTCTFGGNPIRLRRSRYGDRPSELNRRAAELAREVADQSLRRIAVGGSMGPTGEMLAPFGALEAAEVEDAFAVQAEALEAGGVDFLVLETFFALEEAEAALAGARRAAGLPIVMTFSYDRGTRTMMGVTPEKMWGTFEAGGLAAVGANCGTTLDNMLEIVGKLAAGQPPIPIWAKPNAGVPEGAPPVYPVRPADMGEFMLRIVEAGARIVGGCCGNSPDHIRAIAEALGR